MAKVVTDNFADRVTMILCALIIKSESEETKWPDEVYVKRAVEIAAKINKGIEEYLNE